MGEQNLVLAGSLQLLSQQRDHIREGIELQISRDKT